MNRAIANELWLDLCIGKGSCWLPILTNSMAPLMRAGDRVLVRRLAAEQIHFGDIVVFRRNSDLIAHRIFRKLRTADGLRFTEKGDMGLVFGLVRADNVVGRITAVKARRKTLSFTSRLSQLANLVLAAWLYWTAVAATSLKSAKSRTIRRVGGFLSVLLPLSSNILVRLCFAIWYPSGLLASQGKDTKNSGTVESGAPFIR